MTSARIESLEYRLFLAAQPVILGGDGQGHSVSISNGDFSPSRADSTDFGYNITNTNQYTISRTFILQNTGDEVLNLRASNAIVLQGDTSFSVYAQPAVASLAAKAGDIISSTTFTIRFTPTTAGAKDAQLQVLAENGSTLFSFMIAGRGLAPSTAYETGQGGSSTAMHYATTVTGSGTAAASGSLLNLSYAGYLLNGSPDTQFNFGSASANAPLVFTLGDATTLKGWNAGLAGMQAGERRILFVPKALAYSSAAPTMPAGLPDADTYIFEAELLRTGAIGAPAVYGGNGLGSKTQISNNDITPALTDSTDFGYTNTGANGYTITRTYNIENTGTTAFTLKPTDSIVIEGISGYDASAFSVKTQPGSTTIQPQGSSGSSATFTISFKPATAGMKKATVKVLGQDGATLHSFVISGAGVAGTALTGTTNSGGPATMEYATTLSGSGTPAADGNTVSVYYSGYLLDGTPTTKFNFDSKSVGSTPFDVKIGAGSVIKGWDLGLKGMQVGETRWLFIPSEMAYGATGSGSSIPANAPLIFKVDMVRFGGAGAFTVSGNGQSIASGDTTSSAIDFTDFGTASLNVPIKRTFMLTGTQGVLGDVNAELSGSGAFTVLSHSSTSVVVQFLPTAVGEANATLTITPQAPGGSPYTFAIKGNTYTEDKTGVAFSYDAIIVKGGGNDDKALLTATTTSSSTTYQLTLNGVVWSESFAPVTGVALSRILMEGGDGDDKLEIGNSVTLAASLSGGAGDDTLIGAGGGDTLDGGDGADLLTGNAGDDSLVAGAGDDTLLGGSGNDTLSGGFGADELDGGAGLDLVTYANDGRQVGVDVHLSRGWGNGSEDDARTDGGESANDSIAGVEQLIGTDLDDTLAGDDAANSISGGGGNDMIVGAGGNDTIDGGAGNDTLRGDAGRDSVLGGDGDDDVKGGNDNDILRGGAGKDTLCGDAGDDSVFGDAGDDEMFGNAGNDVLWGGFGADVFSGGAGRDSASYADESRTVGVSVSQNYAADDGSVDDLSEGRGDDVASDIEIIGTTPHADTVLAAGRGDRIIWTYGGDDTITGSMTGRNDIWGGGGNDTIIGGARRDRLYGDDSSSPTAAAGASDGNDVIKGGAGNDTIIGGGGADTLNGNRGNDWIYAKDSLTDTIDGGLGYNRAKVDPTDSHQRIKKLLD